MKEPKFKNYKEKQQYYKDLSEKGTLVYDTGKRTNKKGVRRIKGVPYINEDKRLIKEERKQRKLRNKLEAKRRREERMY